MPGNSFGQVFVVTSFGESHGPAVGVTIDGCPAGHPFPHARIVEQLARRRPGQPLSSTRNETDEFEILSGVEPHRGVTLGTPITLLVRNHEQRSKDYETLREVYRPSHADFTWDARFGLRYVEGGGRASARETVARVAAGAIAEDLLETLYGTRILAWVHSVGPVVASAPELAQLDRAKVDATAVRCPDVQAAATMIECIERVRKDGDTVGGVIRCAILGAPTGLGEPVFHKLTADLAHAMMSLPASRGFEIGQGFAAAALQGSAHNDPFVPGPTRPGHPFPIATSTNHSGGIQGGISNGETIDFAVAFKPVATIFQDQTTVTTDGSPTTYRAKGRHDPCVVPRAVPIVESMAALVLFDHVLRRLGARVEELGP